MQKLLASYLFKTGILAHLFLMAALLFPTLVLKEPLGVFLERTVNYLYYYGGSSKQRYFGQFVLNNFPINDWAKPKISQLPLLSDLKNWQGQGASKNSTFLKQQFNGYSPIQPTIGSYLSSSQSTKLVYTTADLLNAIKYAEPGDTIQLMPGSYYINRNVAVTKKGFAHAPITVRSSKLGQVKINLKTSEGFHVQAPYWVFENLEIQGQCKKSNHIGCEHAFHIVGKAHSFVLRNNIIYDFNAPIKVNQHNIKGITYYPDHGLIEKNSFFNTSARHTYGPVTLLNINNGSSWVVRSNLIADFSKALGDRTSYGTFMKGNSSHGLYENNLIICEHTLPADIGLRIGLSLGGGGTGQEYCRENNCEIEHDKGVIRNNIILNCSHDVGIYLNKAKNTKIYNNLLFNNLGIDVRFNSSSASISNNIISGRIKKRDGGTYTETNNLIDQHCIASDRQFNFCSLVDWYWDIINAETGLKQDQAEIINKGIEVSLESDFCGNPRDDVVDIGPIEYSNKLKCSVNKANIQ